MSASDFQPHRRLHSPSRWRPQRNVPLIEPIADTEAESLAWLWPGWIPGNKISLLVGPDGIGKSMISLDIAARLTTGRPWPDEDPQTPPRPPANVLILTEVEDASDTIRPRLVALGADTNRVFILKEIGNLVPTLNKSTLFSLEGTMQLLVDTVRSIPNCRLLVIDPLSTYWESVGRNRPMFLAEFTEMARRLRLAVLIINRVPRFADAARAVWTVVPDGHDPERRLLVPVKNNLAADNRGMGFRITASAKPHIPRLTWEKEIVDVSALESPSGTRSLPRCSRPPSRREMARVWLEVQLRDGPRFSQELLAEARSEQIAERTLRRAFEDLKGEARKGATGLWLWNLPVPKDSVTGTNQLCQPKTLGSLGQVGKVGQHEPRVA